MKLLIIVSILLFVVGCSDMPYTDNNGIVHIKVVQATCIDGHIYYLNFGPKLTDDGKPCHCEENK